MTKGDTESIWKTTLDDDGNGNGRFTKIGVRIAEILNFAIMQDATTQITNTAVTPILEQLSEECLFDLIATAKTIAVPNPWEFVQTHIVGVMSRLLRLNKDIIDNVKKTLNRSKSIEIVSGVKL